MAETDTETEISADISAETDTDTENFRSLKVRLYYFFKNHDFSRWQTQASDWGAQRGGPDPCQGTLRLEWLVQLILTARDHF